MRKKQKLFMLTQSEIEGLNTMSLRTGLAVADIVRRLIDEYLEENLLKEIDVDHKNDRNIEILKLISSDMENDSKNFEGWLLTPIGRQGAAIATLSDIVRSILEDAEEGGHHNG